MIDLIFLALAGFFIYKRKILDLEGTLAAFLMALIIGSFANTKWLVLLFIFLFVGYVSTRYKFDKKKSMNIAESYDGSRSLINVIANGAVPTFMALLWYINYKHINLPSLGEVLKAGYIAAIATVTGDTLSSEIGVLSKEEPVLITTLKKVRHGENGAISLLGELAGIAGALIIGISAYLLGLACLRISLIAALIGGVVGFHLDSLLGALLERRKLIGNGTVNFLSSIAGSLVGITIAMRFYC